MSGDRPIQNWDDLRFFLAIAHAGTLAQAARDLGVKVSTVHRRLGSLEEQWSTRLFDRTPRGHVLTAAGESLLANADRVQGAVHDLSTAIAEVDPRRVLRLTATDDLIDFLSPHIAAFCANDAVQVRLMAGERVYNLAQREADVAIRFAPPDQDELVSRDLAPMAFALYASRKYVERHGAPSGLDDLHAHQFAIGDHELGESPPNRWLVERVAPSQVIVLANTVSTLAAAVRGGMGIAALPCFLADVDPALERVHPPIDEVSAQPRLMYHYRQRSSPALLRFVTFLEQAFADSRALFSGRNPTAAG